MTPNKVPYILQVIFYDQTKELCPNIYLVQTMRYGDTYSLLDSATNYLKRHSIE